MNEEKQSPRLDELEERNLRAAVLRVLPSDDGVGAAEAGCPDYVISRVRGRLPAASAEKLRRGLSFAEKLAQQTRDTSFADADEATQDLVLRQLHLTPHPTVQEFIHRLVNLTLEGFLCHPRHGGNRNGVGWSYLGIDDCADAGSGNGKETSCTTP